MTTFNVPAREDVSPANQAMFDALKGQLTFVPNLYATLAHSENALGTYLALQSAKSSLNPKAREIINLVVSQVNECEYCLAAHIVIGGLVGFKPEQILEIRAGTAAFDTKLDALAKLTRDIATHHGHADQSVVEAFFNAGWTKENLVDAIVTIGDKTVTNYLHGTTKVPVDFPVAPKLVPVLMAA